MLPTNFLFAQEVAKVIKAKNQVLAHYDDSTKAAVGQEACFSDAANKKLACGKIIKIQKGKILVKIADSSKLSKIKKGMKVTLPGATSKSSNSASGALKPKSPFVLRLVWTPALLGPITYNKVSYSPPSTNPALKSALWKSDQLIRTAFIAFGFESTVPLGPSFGITPGFRYRAYTGSSLETDYDPADKVNRYASIVQKMTALGFWTDLQLLRFPVGSSMAFAVNSGLDFEMSTATLEAKKHDARTSSELDLATMTSKLSAVSLRLGAAFDAFFLGPAGATLGVTVLIPMIATGKSVSAKTEDEFTPRSEDDVADLTEALNHKKASFGAEMTLGLAFGF